LNSLQTSQYLVTLFLARFGKLQTETPRWFSLVETDAGQFADQDKAAPREVTFE
jgi:hypothetical protein